MSNTPVVVRETGLSVRSFEVPGGFRLNAKGDGYEAVTTVTTIRRARRFVPGAFVEFVADDHEGGSRVPMRAAVESQPPWEQVLGDEVTALAPRAEPSLESRTVAIIEKGKVRIKKAEPPKPIFIHPVVREKDKDENSDKATPIGEKEKA